MRALFILGTHIGTQFIAPTCAFSAIFYLLVMYQLFYQIIKKNSFIFETLRLVIVLIVL